MDPIKHVAICTDYDGCLRKALTNQLAQEHVENITYKPRFKSIPCCFSKKVIREDTVPHHLIQHASAKITQHQPTNVTVMNFSNRQDFATDSMNQRGEKGSVTIGTRTFAQQLRDVNPQIPNFCLDKKLLADVASCCHQWQHEAGTTWDGMEYFVKHSNREHPGCKSRYFFDRYKILLTYMQAHRLAARFPEDQIHMYIYDDRVDILNPIASVFGENSGYLPRNLTLYLQEYNGNGVSLTKRLLTISGLGNIDVNHDETYRRYCDTILCSYFNSKAAKDPQQIPANAPNGETLFGYMNRMADKDGVKIRFDANTFSKIKEQASGFAQSLNIREGIEVLSTSSSPLSAATTRRDTTETAPLLSHTPV